MEHKLKPCPRCNKDASELLYNDGLDVFERRRRYKICCNHCGYQTKISVYVGDCIAWWNDGTEVKDDVN